MQIDSTTRSQLLGLGLGSFDGMSWNANAAELTFSPVNPVHVGGTSGVTITGTGLSELTFVDTSPSTIESTCPSDFNGDGATDFFDYDDFVACFEGTGCPSGTTADFNNDGAPDFFDYDDFVTAFETPC